MKSVFITVCLFFSLLLQAQDRGSAIKTKWFDAKQDTIKIDSISIYSKGFKLLDSTGQNIAQQNYQLDAAKAQLIFNRKIFNYRGSVYVSYRPLPQFLTQTYQVNNDALLVPRSSDNGLMMRYQSNNTKKFKPFDGLYTSGSLSRAVTVGNNQDAVVNSNFNLQIEGKLSEDVGIRANITDNEIPLQEGGYTQRLDDFDRVYIELFSDDWKVQAGDVDLINTSSYFMPFTKKISGVAVKADIDGASVNTKALASGALVRGRYHSYNFTGRDGNQGPYRIEGPSNEPYVLMVSGSERIYANGVLLKRGENHDYIIDYNQGEIVFTTIFPVTANIRFRVEYQMADSNYTRFLTFNKAQFSTDKFTVGAQYYLEKDAKNKPVQQDLTDQEKNILANAGNDPLKMIAPSESLTPYSENRILYRKETIGLDEVFVYSNDANDELYQVHFSYIGPNLGTYILKTTLAAGRVYEYVAPVNGINQGEYLPVKQLIAPESKQMVVIHGEYKIKEQSKIGGEIALSNQDQNLFSSIDNQANQGWATKLDWNQLWLNQKWQFKSELKYEFIDQNFKTIERFRSVEFQRDWNLSDTLAIGNTNQQYISGLIDLTNTKNTKLNYRFSDLRFGDVYQGQMHELIGGVKNNNTYLFFNGSALSAEDSKNKNTFYRWYSGYIYHFKKAWLGAKLNHENNTISDKNSKDINPLSHRYLEAEAYGGIGDSSKVYTELGFNYRVTDSLHAQRLQRVNAAHTYFLKSNLIKTQKSNLALFVNYRLVNNEFQEDDKALNTRLTYRLQLWQNKVVLQTLYETQTGNLPQQEFSYVEVEPGKGFYEWIDFNSNGIQELDEFVIAKFPDKAKFVRVLMPNVNYLKTNQNKFSQTIQLNGKPWHNQIGVKKFLSHFYNQAYFLIDTKTKRDDSKLSLNPFDYNDQNLLGLDLNVKNSLFFNRGLQRYSGIYTFNHAKKRSLFVFGDQDLLLQSHQLQFLHKIGKFWLFDLKGRWAKQESASISYSNRNYELEHYDLHPKIAYLLNKNLRLEAFYQFKNKSNQVSDFETLSMHQFGADFQYANREKFSAQSQVNLYFNQFDGQTNSPVAFQMLEGLQPGTNITWLLSLQKRLTSFLDLNIHYSGRTSEAAKTIHTGSVQVRASF